MTTTTPAPIVPGPPAAAAPARRRVGSPPGEGAGNAKLRDADIPAIAAAYRAGESMPRIAARLGVGPTAVHKVLTGETWKHIPGGFVEDRTPRPRLRKERPARVKVGPLRGERQHQAKLTDAKVTEARAAYRAGVPGAEIARRLGLAQSTVSVMLSGKTWTHVV